MTALMLQLIASKPAKAAVLAYWRTKACSCQTTTRKTKDLPSIDNRGQIDCVTILVNPNLDLYIDP